MKIGMLGTGAVAQALTARLLALDHDVVMGTRDPERTLARTAPDVFGNPPLRIWLESHQAVRLATYADAAGHGELVVNATHGGASLDALRLAGEANLDGKLLLDVANPLDFSRGFPPSLLVKDTDSLGEQIQRAFPRARVVKALNTTNARVMVDPGQVAGGQHTVFVCGNDAGAKATVIALLQTFGWQDVLDLGDITAARGTEMMLPVWLRLMATLQTPMFNFRIAR